MGAWEHSSNITGFLTVINMIGAIGLFCEHENDDVLGSFIIRRVGWKWFPNLLKLAILNVYPVTLVILGYKLIGFMVSHRIAIGQFLLSCLKGLIRFSYLVFKFVHCEARVQAGTYAMIGTVIGWQLESPLIGATIGAVLGVVSYRFVTTRFLKPAVTV
jgi:hypothetical protein